MVDYFAAVGGAVWTSLRITTVCDSRAGRRVTRGTRSRQPGNAVLGVLSARSVEAQNLSYF